MGVAATKDEGFEAFSPSTVRRVTREIGADRGPSGLTPIGGPIFIGDTELDEAVGSYGSPTLGN